MSKILVDKDAVVREIVRLYEDPQGFLVQVHSRAEFDSALFEEIVETIEAYHALVKQNTQIDKRVARFLYDTASTLEGTLYQLDQLKRPTKALRDAHAVWLSLIDDLLAIEPPDPNAEIHQQLTLL